MQPWLDTEIGRCLVWGTHVGLASSPSSSKVVHLTYCPSYVQYSLPKLSNPGSTPGLVIAQLGDACGPGTLSCRQYSYSSKLKYGLASTWQTWSDAEPSHCLVWGTHVGLAHCPAHSIVVHLNLELFMCCKVVVGLGERRWALHTVLPAV